MYVHIQSCHTSLTHTCTCMYMYMYIHVRLCTMCASYTVLDTHTVHKHGKQTLASQLSSVK